MKKNRNLLIVTAGVLLVGLMVSFAFAAEGDPATEVRQGGRAGRSSAAATPQAGQGRQTREEAQQRNMERVKTELGASEKEWTVIEPKLTKVMKLSRELNQSGMSRGGRGGRGGEAPAAGTRPQGEANAEQSELQKKSSALQEILKKSDAKPEEIKAGLAAYRQAKEKAKVALAAAQKDLKASVNVTQEAKLVLLGQLD